MSPKMPPDILRKISAISKYAIQKFTSSDWRNLGELTGQADFIGEHRLLKALGFGDDDYEFRVEQVLKHIAHVDQTNIDLVFGFYNILDWLKENDTALYSNIAEIHKIRNPGFWKANYLKLFISHLARDKEKANSLKLALERWGITSFVAHTDIEPTKEWMTEIESALDSMDCLVAMIAPNFKESDWTDQEVGYALGRHIDIITLRIEFDPYGFMGKFQGIQAKGKYPNEIALEIATALFKKPNHRVKLLQSLKLALSPQKSDSKIEIIKDIDARELIGGQELKDILESIALSDYEKSEMSQIIDKVGAFKIDSKSNIDDDLPF